MCHWLCHDGVLLGLLTHNKKKSGFKGIGGAGAARRIVYDDGVLLGRLCGKA